MLVLALLVHYRACLLFARLKQSACACCLLMLILSKLTTHAKMQPQMGSKNSGHGHKTKLKTDPQYTAPWVALIWPASWVALIWPASWVELTWPAS
jgi:hypothetical protein